MTKLYTPAQVEHFTGWHVQGLRDMRHKGYLPDIGTIQDNGRWLYGDNDILAFSIASIMHSRSTFEQIDLKQIFDEAKALATPVLAHLRGAKVHRFFVWEYSTKRTMGGLEKQVVSYRRVNDLNELLSTSSYHRVVFDVQAFFALLPVSLVEELQGAT